MTTGAAGRYAGGETNHPAGMGERHVAHGDDDRQNAEKGAQILPWPDDAARPGAPGAESEEPDKRLMLDLGAYEGPLDLLLDLARRQKVDLAQISILALAEQYLAAIHEARRMNLELAADWLVMAAWLAWLKSRLLLPVPPDEDDALPPQEMAARLAFRLQRLQAMRDAAKRLMAGVQLGRDVFARGMPEPVRVLRQAEYTDTLVDLLRAYGGIVRRKVARRGYQVEPQPVWTISQARETLERLVGRIGEWSALDGLLLEYLGQPQKRRSAIASGFAAALELAREGDLELRQEAPFAPLLVRSR